MNLKSTGTRINMFDDLEVQTVKSFNMMFPECMLLDYPDEERVSILDYSGFDKRTLFIAGMYIQHKMYRDVLYGMDRDAFYEPEKDEPLTEMYGYPV